MKTIGLRIYESRLRLFALLFLVTAFSGMQAMAQTQRQLPPPVPQNCTTPTVTPDGCQIYGARSGIGTGTYSSSCGQTIELSPDSVTLVQDPNASLIITHGDSNIYAYTNHGNNLTYNATSPFLEFYCMFTSTIDPTDPNPPADALEQMARCDPHREPCVLPPEVIKVPVPPLNQFIAVGNGNGTAAIAIDPRGGSQKEFIVMHRYTDLLNPHLILYSGPQPNPGYFTSRGAIDVDPLCIPKHELLSPLPVDFGDIKFQHDKSEQCTISYAYPATIDANPYYDPCHNMIQYINQQYMNMYAGAGQTFEVGSVGPGGNSYITHVARPNPGAFTPDANTGHLTYQGSYATLGGGSYLALSTAAGTRTHNFVNGAAFNLNDNYTVYTEPPGRITLNSNGDMQLLDGGTIEDKESGETVRVIAPMGYVQFGGNRVIDGATMGNIALPATALIPTLPGGHITQPYNAKAQLGCAN